MSIRRTAQSRRSATTGSCLAYVFALIGATFVIGGCSDFSNLSTAPEGLEDNAGLTGSDDVSGNSSIESVMDLSPGPEWTVEQQVDKHRAIMLLDGKELRLTFPPKSVTGNVTIVARMDLNDERGRATRVNFDFKPSTSFPRPVQLSVSSTYLAGTSNTYKLWTISPALGRVQMVDEKAITPGQVVVFDIDHFSAYALSR